MTRMDVREKLIDILKQAPFEGKVLDEWWFEEKIAKIADYLVSHSVTVQEWISVKDMLPEENEIILAWVAACRDLHFCFGSEVSGLEVTHWMPLPEPPEDGTV